MKPLRSNRSFAVAGGSLLAFAVLSSGVWHKRFPIGGRTQVGRSMSVAFEDGSVLQLDESDTDQAILKRRRMAGWHGHEYRQVFVTSDGQEVNVLNNRIGVSGEDEDFSTGDHLILAANSLASQDVPPPLDNRDGVVVANLQIDGKVRMDSAVGGDEKNRVMNDVIDGKDRYIADGKDGKDAPVFALSTTAPALGSESIDELLMGDLGSDWNNLRSPSGELGSTGGNVTAPPIGVAVPEPTTFAMIGLAGALGLASYLSRRHRAAR